MSLKIRVLPVKRLCALNGERKLPAGSAAVLCTMNPVKGQLLEGVRYIHLEFADVLDPKRPDIFTREHGLQIKAFVDGLPEHTPLFFCCDSGQSRSTALAAAFKRYLHQDEGVIWEDARYRPNRWIYSLQCKICGRPSAALRTNLLVLRNRWVFKRRLRK